MEIFGESWRIHRILINGFWLVEKIRDGHGWTNIFRGIQEMRMKNNG